MFPVKRTKRNTVAEENEKLITTTKEDDLPPLIIADNVDENSNLVSRPTKTNLVGDKLQEILGIYLFKDFRFLNISAGIALIFTVSINFSLLFPLFLKNSANLSIEQTAFAMTILATGDVFSRLTLPIITDRLKLSARVTLFTAVIILMFIRAALAESQSYQEILILSGAFGYVRASTVVNQSLCLAEYCKDPQLLSSALGLTMILKAISVISIGQFLGYTRDLTNSYRTSLHIQNAILGIVVMAWLCEFLFKRIRKWRLNKKKKGYELLT